MVGLYKLNAVDPRLETAPPGFNPCAYEEVKTQFHKVWSFTNATCTAYTVAFCTNLVVTHTGSLLQSCLDLLVGLGHFSLTFLCGRVVVREVRGREVG